MSSHLFLQVKPREKSALRVSAKLVEKFAHHPAIKRIHRHRQVPKHVYNARNEMRSGRIAAKRKCVSPLTCFSCISHRRFLFMYIYFLNVDFLLQGIQRSHPHETATPRRAGEGQSDRVRARVMFICLFRAPFHLLLPRLGMTEEAAAAAA